MTVRDADKIGSEGQREGREGDGHSTTPQVQTPDKPSQAEGDRETIDESIKEKEEEGIL
ncbi:MAG: hypothetical protein ABIO92_05815 [Chloroflexia bacterium]